MIHALRIGIDAHYLSGRVFGRETYLNNLIRNLLVMDRENEYVLYVRSPQVADDFQDFAGPRVRFRPLQTRSTALERCLILPALLRQDGIEVLYVHTLGVPFFLGRTILVSHGIEGLWTAPFPIRLALRALLPWSLRNAFRVIANSSYTAREIATGYGVPQQRIRVAPGGVDLEVFRPADAGLPDDAPARLPHVPPAGGNFCAYLGAIEERKNLLRLLHAFAQARRHLADPLGLVIAGSPRDRAGARFRSRLMEEVASLGLASAVEFLDYLPPLSAAALLRRARFFVFPSVHESFGLPPLEAMACGTPVLAARAGALPDVLGDAALWCDPANISGIADGIRALASDAALRARLREKGQQQAGSYTWKNTALRTLEVFREAAGAGPDRG